MSPFISEHTAMLRREAWQLADALAAWRELLERRFRFSWRERLSLEGRHRHAVDAFEALSLFEE